ncbi:MAG: hypothetical protein SGILL_001634 [Bacillariaceae sp.]
MISSSTGINGKKPEPLLRGASLFEAMAHHQKQEDIREQIHTTRRRRLSLKSSCSADGDEHAADADSSSTTDANRKDTNSSSSKGDIRRELQQLEGESGGASVVLPDPSIHESPEDFLQKLVKIMCDGLELETKKARSLEGFFAKLTDEAVEAYTTTVVTVCRNNDLAGLKELQAKGQTLNCFNRFGESLLHMACRRGFEDIVDFLLEQPDVDIRMCDDNGRTVLHDACWNPNPQLKICQRILERDPCLFFISDNRGCSAFQYARPEHWDIWRKFLLENRESLRALNHPDVLEKLAKAP